MKCKHGVEDTQTMMCGQCAMEDKDERAYQLQQEMLRCNAELEKLGIVYDPTNPSPPYATVHNVDNIRDTVSPDRLRERAVALVAEWIDKDPSAQISPPWHERLEDRIAAFARAEREAALRELDKAEEVLKRIEEMGCLYKNTLTGCGGCKANWYFKSRDAGGDK